MLGRRLVRLDDARHLGGGVNKSRRLTLVEIRENAEPNLVRKSDRPRMPARYAVRGGANRSPGGVAHVRVLASHRLEDNNALGCTAGNRAPRDRGWAMVDQAEGGSGVATKIVVGTDGSETAERAVLKATALAKAVGAELIVVSAYATRAPAGAAAAGIPIDSSWVAEGHAEAETCAKEAGERARAAGVTDVWHKAAAGSPADALIKVTVDEDSDLLVVGSKGMQSTARFLLGPIAQKVTRRVPCDLLIVETSQ